MNGEKEERIDSVVWHGMSDIMLANLSLLFVYQDNLKQAKEMIKTVNTNNYLIE